MGRRLLGALFAAVAILAMPAAAQAQSVSFAGKQVKILIGFSPTGFGYDTYGRLLARHLGKYLPGHPVIVPQNRPKGAVSTRQRIAVPPDGYAIYHEFTPQPEDVIITKQRASIFQGTPLSSHLSLLGIQSLIVCGESTSGCVRASAVDGYSSGFHVSLVEECTFDRAELTHKVNLFDLHHKYVDVMHLDEVVAHLDAMRMTRAAE